MKKSGLKKPMASLLASHYKRKIQKAKEKLIDLPAEQASVKLDFKSLEITSKLGEYKFYLNPMDEGLSAQLYAWKFREPLNTHFLSRFISNEKQNIDIVVDIGSNIGYFPLIEIVSGAPQVIAIEPIPETYLFLKKNLDRFENTRMLNIAVSDKKEIVKMYVPTQMNLATIFVNTAYLKMAEASIKEIVDVQALTFEDLLETENLAGMNVLIRMDIEGFEKNVVKKLPEEVYGLSFELHSYILGYYETTALMKKLRRLGYKVQLMVRELGKLAPIIKFLGVRRALRLYESLVGTRVFYEPSIEIIKNTIKEQRENPHIFAVRS